MCDNRVMSSTPNWLNEQEHDVWRRWLTTHTTINAVLGRHLSKDSCLSLTEYEVLVVLSEHPEGRLRMAAMAEKMQWDKSRLSHQITRMVKRGLVDRVSCQEDKRSAFVELRDEGLEAIREAAPPHVDHVRELLFDHLNQEQLDQLQSILQTLDAKLHA